MYRNKLHFPNGCTVSHKRFCSVLLSLFHTYSQFVKVEFRILRKCFVRYCTCYNIIHGIEHIISSAGCLCDAQNQSHKNSNVQKRSRTVSDLLRVMLLGLILLHRHKLHQTLSHSFGLVTCSCTYSRIKHEPQKHKSSQSSSNQR